MATLCLKHYLPHLFHGFRNKYFNKISLDSMLYFHNKLPKLSENVWFFDIYGMKKNVQSKMQIAFFLMASKTQL